MHIAKHKVVSINYTLTDQTNTVLDSSAGGDPLVYIHGSGHIIPGLENALNGKVVGDALKVTVPPQEAYGLRDEVLKQTVPRDRFEPGADIHVGMRFQSPTDDGVEIVTVTHLDDQSVTVDANHPLAGMTLNFDVEVLAVRDASAEELSHGHVHGAGGHHHE